jgi:hypothetical protein
MAVVFKTFDQIEIDGIASGNIVDVISNHSPKRLQVLEAYKVFTDKLNADHAEALQEIQTDLDEANANIATLTAKVVDLEQYRPYNPRILAGEAFYNRVAKEDMVTLLTSDNTQLVIVGKTIEAYRANNWPVILDSTDFQQLVGYVLQSGVFDEAEVVGIMRDATREEAYRVPE